MKGVELACVAASVSIVLCAGCGGTSASFGVQPPLRIAGARRVDHSESWMARGAVAQNLLYLSNYANGDVRVYAYPAGTPVGALTGFAGPAGLCSDKAGNVWIVNSPTSALAEYAHGATSRIKTLYDFKAVSLLGCAVDPVTGELAATDLGSAGEAGHVSIYAKGARAPTRYYSTYLHYVYFCGYDKAGNLFVDGLDVNNNTLFVEISRGSKTLKEIRLNRSVDFPGGVQWDGKYVAVGDQEYDHQHESAIYQVSVSGLIGTIVGVTKLDASCDVLQFWIAKLANGQSSQVVAPDDCLGTVKAYPYPAGGSATKRIAKMPYPVGAAVSVAR
jgi:hypothetical protein